LREALVHSRNLVSIRVLNTIGIDYALDFIQRFGFDPKQQPHNLSLALGSGVVTPLQMATGYCVFANGGYRVKPFLIDRIETVDGKSIFKAKSGVGERVIPAANAYQMTSMLADVVRRGTGAKVAELGRSDLAGKTGTTNDQRDAWFSGYNGDVVATSWVGFDKQKPLGSKEVGAIAALPMWMDFMSSALKGRPQSSMPEPSGLVRVRIDSATGSRANADSGNAMFELFREGQTPEEKSYGKLGAAPQPDGKPTEIPEQMF
jgi:penicillin-binding protein 1A